MSVTTSNSVWQQFRQLSEIARDTDIEIVLRRLVEWFEADGIGLTRHDAVEPELSFFPMRPVPHVFPWQTDVGVRKQLEASSSAETFHNSVGEWLIAPVLEPGRATTSWAWLYRLNGRNWNEAEPWLWQYASRFLIPRQKPTIDSPTSAEWKQRLDLAALVTGRLSHDFGNYLTGIMGFTELSLMHVDADSAPHRFMQEVLEAARNGADWLRRLHHFCRRGPMGGWPTVISSVLAAEEARLRSTGMAGMRWLTEVPADLSLVAMDALSLQTALAELANNACEATKFEGTIRIKAGVIELTQAECRALLGSAAPGRFVRLSVADDGPGFTPQHRERLSRELFFSTKPKQRGLGLPVVYGILQRCAGALRIGAPTEGAGARVELYLPVADIAPVTPRPDAPPVLVVQSDPHLLESMRRAK